MQVLVRDNNVDQALKALKKKMQREGIFREMKLRGHYEKPSEKKAREKAEAVRRARKLARKKMQREGLIPMKPKLMPGAPGAERGGRGGPGRAAVAARGRSGGRLRRRRRIWRRRRFRPLDPPFFGCYPRRGPARTAARAMAFLRGLGAIVERSPHSLGEQPGSRPAATEPRSIEQPMTTTQRSQREPDGPLAGGSPAPRLSLCAGGWRSPAARPSPARRPPRSRTTSSPPRPPTSPR